MGERPHCFQAASGLHFEKQDFRRRQPLSSGKPSRAFLGSQDQPFCSQASPAFQSTGARQGRELPSSQGPQPRSYPAVPFQDAKNPQAASHNWGAWNVRRMYQAGEIHDKVTEMETDERSDLWSRLLARIHPSTGGIGADPWLSSQPFSGGRKGRCRMLPEGMSLPTPALGHRILLALD